MEQQLDLIKLPDLSVEPESGRNEPVLWVRRFVVWSEPGQVLRQIEFQPGFNIIWSPDPEDQGKRRKSKKNLLGHGSGKTMLCRLLRYCLGENHFAPEGQRQRVGTAFPKGQVGAEVLLNGKTWGIIRPIGLTRKHYAVQTALDELTAGAWADSINATGISPFLEAVENQILSPEVVALIPSTHPLSAWPVALAWLTRDQECRFDKLWDWRSSDSDSGSPVRALSSDKIFEAIRALIGAIDPEEQKLNGEIERLSHEQEKKNQDFERYGWRIGNEIQRLVTELGLRPEEMLPGRMLVEPLLRIAGERLAQLANAQPSTEIANLDELRRENGKAQQNLSTLEKSHAGITSVIPEARAMASRIQGEFNGLSVQADRAENFVCPICEVPVDRALAEGCKLSHKLPNLEAAKSRFQKVQGELSSAKGRLESLQSESSGIQNEITRARQKADESKERLRAVEKFKDAQSDEWYKIRRQRDDVLHLGELLDSKEAVRAHLDGLIATITGKRQRTAEYREAKAEIFNRLSRFFDAVIRKIVGPTASGKISLDGNGIRASVEMGGDRSTAAIDSLKVIAFDLAVLCMSIEGATAVPAFLVHDSPREADLGASIYHRIFDLARQLEKPGKRPIFQYILTTTSSPPEKFSKEPWLRAKLQGTPADGRLLKRDL